MLPLYKPPKNTKPPYKTPVQKNQRRGKMEKEMYKRKNAEILPCHKMQERNVKRQPYMMQTSSKLKEKTEMRTRSRKSGRDAYYQTNDCNEIYANAQE